MMKRRQKTYIKVSFTATIKIIVTIKVLYYIIDTVNLEIFIVLLPHEATKMKITAIYIL